MDWFLPLNSITITLNFGLGLLVFLVVAAIVGAIAEFVMHWHIPGGIIGAIFAGLVGVWIMTNIIIISGIGDIYVENIPIVRAFIGAIIMILLFRLFTGGSGWRRRRRAP
jgi:uncharacterized membrane protein YeaQ/YmgE (transglycosylase-associated protein family)